MPAPLSFAGKAVSFNLSGFEPDFDPLYRVVISGSVHDGRPAGRALPDATLIFSAYLESFQPDTIPVLPDLLHPNQVASGLGGFVQGKAALVNAAGHVVYRGSLLAEIFTDSTEHVVVDLTPAGAGPYAAAVRIQGKITLKVGGTESGVLQPLQPLARAALAVPRGPAPSWQAVVASLSVRPPAMVGTAPPSRTGHRARSVSIAPALPLARPRATQRLPSAQRTRATRTAAPALSGVPRLAIAAALAVGAVLVLGLVMRGARRRRTVRPSHVHRA